MLTNCYIVLIHTNTTYLQLYIAKTLLLFSIDTTYLQPHIEVTVFKTHNISANTQSNHYFQFTQNTISYLQQHTELNYKFSIHTKYLPPSFYFQFTQPICSHVQTFSILTTVCSHA